ncbi:MAG: 1-acyl-sn-glycerol-3-phosphate acyltransferase [Polyangiaceae bacterium]
MSEPFVRSVLRTFFRRIVSLYFREVESSGVPPQSDTRGRVFFANHYNGLIDPVLILSLCDFSIAPLAKSTLWDMPLMRTLLDTAGAVPVVRRRDNPDKAASDTESMFEKVALHLRAGGNILIFPEGTSHSEAHLVPLKSGAARMLVRAHEAGGSNLTYQGIGLEFDAKDSFRSRALLTYGPVRSLDGETAKGDELVTRVQSRMKEDLDELVVTANDWDDRVRIDLIASMYENDARRDASDGDQSTGSLLAIQERAIRVETTRAWFELNDVAALVALRGEVTAYYEALCKARTSDAAVLGLPGPRAQKRLLFFAPLALVGVILYYVPYQIPRWVVAALRPTKDVVSTYKLGAGLVAFGGWAVALSILSMFLPMPLAGRLGVLAVVLLSPFAALRWVDRRDDFKSLGETPDETTRAALLGQREALMKRLDVARAQGG